MRLSLPAAFLLFLLPLGLFSLTVSDNPEAQLLAEQALVLLENGNYGEALTLFRQAKDLDGENTLIDSYIASLNRIVTLEDFQADPANTDAFIESREEAKATPKAPVTDETGEVDFITREQNKEKARLERTLGEILITFPVLNSSRGNGTLDNDLRLTGEILQGVGYNFAYYPDLFNRTIGLEGGWETYSLYLENELNLFDEARAGIVLRNFFNEQPGFYSLIGTRISAGLQFGENRDTLARGFLSFWRFEAYFRDPLLYRIIKADPLKHAALEGRFRFSLLNDTYMVGYGGGVSVDLGTRLSARGSFLYRSYLDQNLPYPSWTANLGLNYSFR